MFFMSLGIRGTFGFADYESGGRRGDTDSHFRCIKYIFEFIIIY